VRARGYLRLAHTLHFAMFIAYHPFHVHPTEKQVLHPDPQSPFYKDDTSRFLWNALAAATAGSGPGARGAACDPVKNKCPAGQVRGGSYSGAGKTVVTVCSCVGAMRLWGGLWGCGAVGLHWDGCYGGARGWC
jgi:hypothetical protein